MGRVSNTTQRRAQIVQGLKHVMAAHGYEGATIAAVAADCGLGAGLVHYHFESKLAILVELVQTLAEGLEARRRDAVSETGEPRAQLRAWLDARVALGAGADRDAVACWVEIGAAALRLPEVKAVYAAVLAREQAELEALVAAAASRRLSRARRRHIASTLLAAMQGAWALGITVPELLPAGFAQPAVHTMVEAFLGA